MHCPAGARPPPPWGPRPGRHRAPSQRLPPPAAPTSRSPDQGPDVESSPQAGSSGAVHSAAPASSSHRLTPPPGRTLGAPRLLRAGVRAPASPQPQSPGPAAPRHATPVPEREAQAVRVQPRRWGLRRRGTAGGQWLLGGRRACPRSPAEWRLLCDPSPGRGRRGCCCRSARSCSRCSSAPLQVGALSSAFVGRERRAWAGERGDAGGACRVCVWGGLGSSSVALTTGHCPFPATSRERLREARPARGRCRSTGRTVGASPRVCLSPLRSPGRRLQGPGACCPLSPFPPRAIVRPPAASWPLWPAPAPRCPPAGAAAAARGFIYIVSLVAASPRRGRGGSARLPGFAVGVPSRLRAGERVGELSAPGPRPPPNFLGARRRREGWNWTEKRVGSCVADSCPGGEGKRYPKPRRKASK